MREGKIYHGTNFNNAVKILRDGEILSPWFNQLRLLEAIAEDDLRFAMDSYKVDSIKELALRIASEVYGVHEIEHRVKCISFSDFNHASSYASNRCVNGSGVVFGINKDVVDCSWDNGVIFVPKNVELEKSLSEVYVDRRLSDKFVDLSSRYNVDVKPLG